MFHAVRSKGACFTGEAQRRITADPRGKRRITAALRGKRRIFHAVRRQMAHVSRKPGANGQPSCTQEIKNAYFTR